MSPDEGRELRMTVRAVDVGPATEGFRPVRIETSRGVVEGRHHPVPGATRAAVFVGGAGGGWDTPGRGRLYPDLCEALPRDGIAALRVRYRRPAVLEESVLDVLAALAFLEREGVRAAALTGHSFGGAVVIQAGAASELVRTVVALSTQSHGAAAASRLGPRASLLLAHGTDDRVLPASCSEWVHSIAAEPKELVLLPGTDHGLDETADEVRELVRAWILVRLEGETAAEIA